MKNEDKIRELCEAVKNECDACYGDIDFDCGDCIDCTQGGKAKLAEQILELLQEEQSMNEIEKLYENAVVEKLRYCFAGCKYAFCNSCDDCNVADKMVYPQFTAEKQIELIKWLLYHELIDYLKMSYTSEEGGILDISIKCMSGYSYKNDDDDDFDIALASLINGLWQDLTEEEKQQIKEILE